MLAPHISNQQNGHIPLKIPDIGINHAPDPIFSNFLRLVVLCTSKVTSLSTFSAFKYSCVVVDMIPFTHPVQWAVGLVGAYTVYKHAMNLYDPTNFMKAFQIPTKETARSFAFILVLLNSYDVMGALQNNWAVYWFAAVSRIFAATLFWSLGPPWSKLVTIELVTLAVIVVGMFLG